MKSTVLDESLSTTTTRVLFQRRIYFMIQQNKKSTQNYINWIPMSFMGGHTLSLCSPLFVDWFGQVANSVYVIWLWHHHHCCHVLSLLSHIIVVICMQQFWLHLQGPKLHIQHVYWHTSPINACWGNWSCTMLIAFVGHICCWHIFCHSIVNVCCIFWFLTDVCSNVVFMWRLQ